MVFELVSWEYQDEVTSAKLAQMVEQVRAHDHRPDGSQGAALVEDWTTLGLSPGSGWSIGRARARRLLGGVLIALDVIATRTGAGITFNDETSGFPGALGGNSTVATGIPGGTDGYRPPFDYRLHADRDGGSPVAARLTTAGEIQLTGGTTAGRIPTGHGLVISGFVWRA